MPHTISVVITTYNLERYVAEAVESVVRQTRPALEIIVADDHSTDRTVEVARERGGNIRVVRQPANGGALRNTLSGLDAATGDVVAFLDGDDVWAPTKLARIGELFDADPRMVIASHDHERVDEAGRPLGIEDDTNANVRRITGSVHRERWSDAFRESILTRRGYWFGSAYAIRRSALDRAMFQRLLDAQPELVKWSYLDLVLGPYITASNPERTVGFVNERLFQYRIHATGTSGSTADMARTRSSLQRSQYTNRLTRVVLQACGVGSEVLARFDQMDAVHQLARLQYEGQRAGAARHFINVAPQLATEGLLVKELARLAATTALGVTGFLKVKNGLATARRAAKRLSG